MANYHFSAHMKKWQIIETNQNFTQNHVEEVPMNIFKKPSVAEYTL